MCNISDLKNNLLDISGIRRGDKNVIVILKDIKEAINSLDKIVDKASYGIKYKGKETAIKMYMSLR